MTDKSQKGLGSDNMDEQTKHDTQSKGGHATSKNGQLSGQKGGKSSQGGGRQQKGDKAKNKNFFVRS